MRNPYSLLELNYPASSPKLQVKVENSSWEIPETYLLSLRAFHPTKVKEP